MVFLPEHLFNLLLGSSTDCSVLKHESGLRMICAESSLCEDPGEEEHWRSWGRQISSSKPAWGIWWDPVSQSQECLGSRDKFPGGFWSSSSTPSPAFFPSQTQILGPRYEFDSFETYALTLPWLNCSTISWRNSSSSLMEALLVSPAFFPLRSLPLSTQYREVWS